MPTTRGDVKTLGILGGGQLGRMLALAAHNLAVPVRCWDEQPDAVASHVTHLHVDSFSSSTRLDAFLDGLTCVTTEWENVPVDLLRAIESRGVPVRPGSSALAVTQDRLLEKQLAQRLGIATPRFVPVDSLAQLEAAIALCGTPCIVKTRRFGYDGKGQFTIRAATDAAACWTAIGAAPGGLIVESFVRFDRELSIIAARSIIGQTRAYPLSQNVHRSGILHTSIAPAPKVNPTTAARAVEIVSAVAKHLDYVGVLAVELFDVAGELFFNEIAPRVHNSGHWTINSSITSQFENHVRAVLDLPLGDTAMKHPGLHAGMVNLVGTIPNRADLLSIPGAMLHDYAKAPRAARKLGHVNLAADSLEAVQAQISAVERLLR